ncbi:TPA: hypothetical protein ACPZJL_001077 [Yersinia enterocolitica]
MKKVTLIASNVVNASEGMRLEVSLDNNNHIELENEVLGKGSVQREKWYDFNVLEFDESKALMDWNDTDFAENISTLDILNRRLAVGELIRYVDGGEHFTYRIDEIKS